MYAAGAKDLDKELHADARAKEGAAARTEFRRRVEAVRDILLRLCGTVPRRSQDLESRQTIEPAPHVDAMRRW